MLSVINRQAVMIVVTFIKQVVESAKQRGHGDINTAVAKKLLYLDRLR